MAAPITAVLSGGGARAAAHVGALEVLHQAGVEPSRYVATSMGAVIAAMAAGGLAPREIAERLFRVRRGDVFRLDRTSLLRGWFSRSLLRPEPFREVLAGLVPARSFAELAIPLSVTATDLDSGELGVFGAGGAEVPLLDALCASTALPPWFPPFLIGERRWADGGLRAVVPLEVAARFPAGLVIAIDVGAGFDTAATQDGPPAPTLLKLWNDTQWIMMASNTEAQRARWGAVPGRPPLRWIRPAVRRGETFAVEQLQWYREKGREAARAALSAQHP